MDDGQTDRHPAKIEADRETRLKAQRDRPNKIEADRQIHRKTDRKTEAKTG
jgi:hypothetical protein